MISCLDHGSVELYSCAPNGKQLTSIVNGMRKGRVGSPILKLPILHFKIVAPVFVILSMNNFKKLQDDHYTPEVHIPKVPEIGAIVLEDAQNIAEHIAATIEAGLTNRSTYVEDGCNAFTASLTSTISTYWSGLITGDLETWWQFSQEKHAPLPIKVYQKAIEDLIKVEYLDIDDLIRRSK